MRVVRVLPLALLLVIGCGDPRYPGYKEVGPEVYMRYITLGEGEIVPADSDSVLFRFRACKPGEEAGSYMSTEQWYLARDLRSGALVPILRRMHVGDSMSVIATGGAWPWRLVTFGTLEEPPDTMMLATEVSLLGIRTPAQVRTRLAELRRIDPLAYERRSINAFIGPDTARWTRWGTSDLRYRIEGTASDTARVHFGDVVHVEWTGKRLEDGVVFDAVAEEGFPWRVGEQDQLIKGLETAVSLLRPGQKGIFVLPSELAYGTRGIPGTLEGGTVVVYEVRLVRVERGS
ncbi:MAG: FKBP-type peptidyl-prolyl cis-trans isomerase [Flavobacteriales bacterium]|nr:FKBP-type peptidyl-prolyl cis-trans isomerase [Flavobacteriales bacterium]